MLHKGLGLITVRMARIFKDLDKDAFSHEIGHQFDEFFCKSLKNKKIRQNDGRFRQNLTPKRIHLHPSHPYSNQSQTLMQHPL